MATVIYGAEPNWADPLRSWPEYAIPGAYGSAWDREKGDKWKNWLYVRKERETFPLFFEQYKKNRTERIIREDMEFLRVIKTIIKSGILE